MPRNKYDWMAFLFFLGVFAAIALPNWYSIVAIPACGVTSVICAGKGELQQFKKEIKNDP